MDMKVSLPMALSLCSDRCRSVAVCCFGTKITHVHHSCHVNGFIIGNNRRGVALQPLSARTHLHFCDHNSPISCQSQLSEKDGVRGQLWELSPSGHRGSVLSSSRISPRMCKKCTKTQSEHVTGQKGELSWLHHISRVFT